MHLQRVAISFVLCYPWGENGKGESMAEVSESLRERGFRLTPQRLLIVEAIQASEDHVSAEEIYEEVRSRYPTVNISTVYRTLEFLKGLGLVTETDLGEGRLRYHLAEKGHHHHLVCQKCGLLLELEESVVLSLRDTLLRNYGFSADFSHLAIFGRCQGCQG